MGFCHFIKNLFETRKVQCLEPLQKAVEESDEIDQDIFEDNEYTIPSFKMATMPIRSVLLETPGAQVNGFLMTLSSMVNPQFSIAQEVSMAPKKNGREANQIAETFIAGKLPFYALTAQYHHGEFNTTPQRHLFSLFGRVDSQGQVQSIFLKPFGKRSHFRAVAVMANSNPELLQYDAEVESQLGTAKYTLSANSETIDCSFVQKLGSKFLIASQLAYSSMTKSFSNAFLLRFSRMPAEKYYLQFIEMSHMVSLSLLSHIDDKTTIVTDFQVSGESLDSSAGLGYRRRGKNFEVVSAIRSNGDLKSIFAYSMQSAFRLKLFLGGNLFSEDFKSGYSITVGGGDE